MVDPAITRTVTRAFALLSLAWAGQAFSQEKPITWHFDTGYSITTGTTHNYMDDGWIIGGGLTWNPNSGPFAVLGELHYSHYGATNEAIQIANGSNRVRVDDGHGEVWGLNANGVYTVPFSPSVRGYLTAGIGEYYRSVKMTQTVLTGGYYCDPWWGYCYPGVIPGEAIVSDESTTRFAWNIGGGVEFPMSSGGSWFIDVRYHQIQTKTATEFIPIQIGFRF
jgi:hypothetical protein